MSWFEKAYESYDHHLSQEKRPNPINHTTRNVDIEITLNDSGKFRSARKVGTKEKETLIPVTEESDNRTGNANPRPHPLCDQIMYCAHDYYKYCRGDETEIGKIRKLNKEYLRQLEEWEESDFSHPKVTVILNYVKKGTLVSDLPGEIRHSKKDIGQLMIRWRVEKKTDDPSSWEDATWEDVSLMESWKEFYRHKLDELSPKSICFVTGEEMPISNLHPKKIRNGRDSAKIISSNSDKKGIYTFRGRFSSANEACGISNEASQKVHCFLKHVIAQSGQKFKEGEPTIIAWDTSGKKIPPPFDDSDEYPAELIVDSGDLSKKLKKFMSGYGDSIGLVSNTNNENVVVMALDSISTGRLAVTFYRELRHSDYINRIHKWRNDVSWYQTKYVREEKRWRRVIGPPSPREIAEVIYGKQVGEKRRRATDERLLNCIVNGEILPYDLIESAIRKASNRVGCDKGEWERVLGVACALYRGYHNRKGRSYEMALETDRNTRDYLFGRLLAVAEHIEGLSLHISEKERSTCAERLTQRFSIHPCSTWRDIYNHLGPYMRRLKSTHYGFWVNMQQELDEIMSMFHVEDFINDSRLSGEYLLGFFCQRKVLWDKKKNSKTT